MTTTRTARRPVPRPMTDRQRSFIKSLVAERGTDRLTVAGKTLVEQMDRSSVFVSTRTASNIIDVLLSTPKRPVAASATPRPAGKWGEIHDALKDVPEGRYAVPSPRDPMKNDYVRISKWRGRRFVNKIAGGSSAGFHKVPVTSEDLLVLSQLIARDPLEAALRFSREHGICSRCASPLTEPRSIAAGFGFTCAKVYGVTW